MNTRGSLKEQLLRDQEEYNIIAQLAWEQGYKDAQEGVEEDKHITIGAFGYNWHRGYKYYKTHNQEQQSGQAL